MNVEQRSIGRGDLAEMVVAAGSEEFASPTQDREWPLRKPVFVAVVSLGYLCAALAFYFMFSAVHPL
jgi:hypothetical protein